MELLLKWIPNSDPDRIGCFQLVDMDSEKVVIGGDAGSISDYIYDNKLVSECGLIWVVWVEGG